MMVNQRSDDDCLVCCLSFVLGVAYEDIPQFVRDHGPHWREEMETWLYERGFEVVTFSNHYPKHGLYLADGWTNRDTAHVCVWQGTEMVMDPHESRAGLTNIRQTYWIMPLTLTPVVTVEALAD